MNKTCAALFLAAGLLAPAGASAQAILDNNQFGNDAGAYCYDWGFSYYGGNFDSGSDYMTGNDWSDTRGASFSGLGFDGSGKGSNKSAYSPASPGIGGQFKKVNMDFRSDASINSTGAYYEVAYAQQYDYVYFTLNQSQNWTFDADVVGTTPANGYSNSAQFSWTLYDQNWNWIDGNGLGSYNGSGDYNQHVSYGGTLGPGSYIFYAQNYAQMVNYYWGGQSTGSASATLSNGVFAIPAPGAGALLGVGGLLAARRRR